MFEGSAAGLICHTSTVPDRALAMTSQINHFHMQMEMHRNAERMRDRMDGDRNNDRLHPAPRFDIPEPFQKFNVRITFDHPYWDIFTADMGGPTFNHSNPDVTDYLRDYNNKVMVMEQLARALMELSFPGTPEQRFGMGAPMMFGQTVAVPNVSVDAVAEIQRLKALMDQGIITEEEYVAKKRQLLGI